MPQFSSGGYDNPSAQSALVAKKLQEDFDVKAPWVVVYLEFRDGASSMESRTLAGDYIDRIKSIKGVDSVESFWDNNNPALLSKDGKIGTILVYPEERDFDFKNNVALAIAQIKTPVGVEAYFTGVGPITNEINTTVKKDILKAELFAIPLSLVMTFFVFGSLVAAATPLVVSLFSIPLALAALWIFHFFTDLSIFGLNIITGLGLGLGIDYALLMVYRFREELSKTSSTEKAVRNTVNTAGRTVIYSGLTVALTMFSLSFFPLFFLQTFAWSGMAVVLLSVVGAVFLLPAVLMLLGDRIDKGFLIQSIAAPVSDRGLWFKISSFVMKRSIPVAFVTTVILVILALPSKGIILGQPDERILPASNPVVKAGNITREGFDQSTRSNVELIIPVNVSFNDNVIGSLLSIPGVSYILDDKNLYGKNSMIVANQNASGYSGKDFKRITIYSNLEPTSEKSAILLSEVKKIISGNPELLIGGNIMEFKDSNESIVSTLPKAIGWIALVTFVLLLLFTKSLLLPIKAVVLNALSLAATFGVLKLVFQDGLFNSMLGGFFVKGSLESSQLVLIVVIVFGLSMDYELFLLSRIKELRDQGASNEMAVALGLQRSGRIITAAAAILAFVFGAFIISDVTSVKMMGFGIAFAILLDATIVRALLVPSLIKIAGKWNWYLPKAMETVLNKVDTGH